MNVTRTLPFIGIVSASLLQAQATLIGTVRVDSGRTPLVGAEVSIEALGRSTRTDEAGRFVLSALAPGLRHVQVRRIGYQSVGKMVQLVAGTERVADFTLERAAVKLDSLVVTAKTRDPVMREFEDNRRIGLGHFFTRVELEKQGISHLAQAFDGIAGVKVERKPIGATMRESNQAYVANRRRNCLSTVYLDNVLMYGRASDMAFNINSIPVDQIEAIEYYSGPAQTPARYSALNSNCGVVVIWTRRTP